MSDPLEEQKLYDLAIEADKRDYCAAAITFFEGFLGLQPNHAFARYCYAQNLLQAGRISDAEHNLFRAMDIPSEKQWLVDLTKGEIEMERGNYQQAERHFRSASEKNPESTVPWVYLGGALNKQERFKDACEVFERGLSAKGDTDEVYLNLGNSFRALKDYAGARRAYLRAIEFTGDHYKAAHEALQDLDFLERPSQRG